MRKAVVLVTVILLLAGSALSSPRILPSAHAALTGLVCFEDPNNPIVSSSNPCPASAPTFDGPAPGLAQVSPTQIKIGIYISGSDALNGFDITLLSNHTILRPAGVNYTGSVVPGSTVVLAECIGGVNMTSPIIGKDCTSADSVDTLHFALAGFPSITNPPTSGLLFVAIYNITGTAPLSGISVGFQTGCPGSPTSDPPFCVTVTGAGGSTPDSETIQAAVFNNHSTPPWIAVSSNSTRLDFLSTTNTGNHANIVATSENGWPGASRNLVSFSAQTNSSGLIASFSASSCTPSTSCNVVLSLSGVGGNYSVTVSGQYVLTDSSFGSQTDTLVGPVSMHVIVRDYFRLTANPTSAKGLANGIANSSITIAPFSGYTGTVLLSSSVTPAGLGCAIAPASIVLGGSQTSTLSCNGSGGVYTVTVTGSSNGLTHSLTVTITIQDFTVTATPASLSVNVGASPTSTILLTSLNGFQGSVKMSAGCSSYLSGGGGGSGGVGGTRFRAMLPFGSCPTASFSPATISLTGSSASSVMTISPINAPGNYSIFVYADSAVGRHATVVRLVISDFVASVPSVYLFVDVGSKTNSTISLTSLVSFSGSVALSATGSPAGLSLSLNPATVSLTAGGRATSVLTVSVPSGTATGNYNVNVTVTGGGVSHSILFYVLVRPLGFLDPPIELIVHHPAYGLGLAGLVGLVIFSLVIVGRRPVSASRVSRKRNGRLFVVSGSNVPQRVLAGNCLAVPVMISLSRRSG